MRRVFAGVSDLGDQRCLPIEGDHGDEKDAHRLHLLRCRLQPRRGHQGERDHFHPGAVRCRGEPRPHLPKGPLRVQVLQPSGPPAHAAHPVQRTLCRGDMGRGLRPHRRESDAHQRSVWRGRGGGDLLGPLHQRGELPHAEVHPRRLRHEQHRCLRARLPFADRLRDAKGLWHRRRHQLGRRSRIHQLHHRSSGRTRPRAIRSPAPRSSSAP